MTIVNPFEVLGIRPTSDANELRRAYHAQAKKYHPDHFRDPEEQKAAQEKMMALNLAYEQALKLMNSRSAPYNQSIACEDAIRLARKMLTQRSPESALRQLMRAESKDGEWYNLQGVILMQMDQYDSAHQSFREAVRRDPDNMEYRRGALDAAIAMKKAKTIGGRLQQLLKPKRKLK